MQNFKFFSFFVFFNTSSLNSLGQLITLWLSNLQNWFCCSLIRKWIAYANDANIVHKDSRILFCCVVHSGGYNLNINIISFLNFECPSRCLMLHDHYSLVWLTIKLTLNTLYFDWIKQFSPTRSIDVGRCHFFPNEKRLQQIEREFGGIWTWRFWTAQ